MLPGLIYFDANVLVFAFERPGTLGDAARLLFEAADRDGVRCATSAVTLAEVLVKPFAEKQDDLVAVYHSVLGGATKLQVAAVSHDVLVRSASLRAELPAVKTIDAIHLETALSLDCSVLVTEDRRLAAAARTYIAVSGIEQAARQLQEPSR